MGDYDRIKEAVSLREYAEANLDHVRGGLVCPNCGSGTGPNKSPAFSIKGGDKWKCFSCGEGGDVYDLAGHVHNIPGKEYAAEQLRIVADWAGISLENDFTSKGAGFQATWTVRTAQDAAQDGGEVEAAAVDYSQGREKHRRYIAECARRMVEDIEAGDKSGTYGPAYEYMRARGFTSEEIISLGIGYDPDYKGKGKTRIIIPWIGADYYHIDRALTDITGKYNKPPSTPDDSKGITVNDCVGEQPIYNPRAADNEVFFIVEGVLDALTIQLVTGYQSIAIASNNISRANIEELAELLNGRDCLPVLMLDTDGPGRDGARRIMEKFDSKGIWYQLADEVPGAKDAAELFARDRAGLASYLEEQYETARLYREERREERREAIRREFHLDGTAKVATQIFNCEGWQEPIRTGFNSLDNVLNGGLRTGLYMLGAVTSAGKTTLMIEIADHIAANGWPVLFVSIEQSARELVSKSLSRMMAQRGYQSVTLFEMANAAYRPYKSPGKENALVDAYGEYVLTIAPHMCILSADRDAPDVLAIARAAEYMRGEDDQGRAPVVIVDYLQLIRPIDAHMTDKQNVDTTVSTLRRIAKELKTPVIAISSLNRTSYNGAIDLDSFKESGSIEYSSDVLLGLQPLGIREYSTAPGKSGGTPSESQIAFKARAKLEEFKHQNPRKCEITVLKNRTGALPMHALPFTFYPASSLFVEG